MFAGSTRVERKHTLEIRELELHERVELNGLAVTPYLMKHFSGAPSYALRIETEGKVLTYSGDTEWVDELIPAGQDADLFICEAYFFDKVMKYHIDYTTLARRLPEIAPKRTIVTHMSAELGRGEIALEAAHGLSLVLSSRPSVALEEPQDLHGFRQFDQELLVAVEVMDAGRIASGEARH
jgi:ribonuclease BN (tRNA processing enzyme)